MTAPMFKVFTDAMVPYTKSIDGVERKFIRTTASSTVTDRKGHAFNERALKKMGQEATGMTIFLNHEYKVPEDLFGSIAASDAKHAGFDSDKNAIWDLDFDVMVNESNPRAVQAWDAYQSGVRMGVSVGVIVKDWEAKKNSDIMEIKDVEFLEASIVGIPANPRTWVQGAVKSISAFSELEKDGTMETLSAIDGALALSDDAVGDITQTVNLSTDEEKEESSAPIDPDNDDSLAEEEEAKSIDEAKTEVVEELHNSSDPEASVGAIQTALVLDASAAPEGSVSAGIDLLANAYKAELQDLRTKLRDATQERDEAQEAARLAMSIVERISALPLGRKATYQREINSFRRDLAGVYGDDFLAFLERKT